MEARKQGRSLVSQEVEVGLVSMTAAIRDPEGRSVAAINISGQTNRTSASVMQDSMLPQLLAASHAMTRLLSVQRA